MPCSGANPRTPRYSLSWAWTIYERAAETHPRGWKFITAVFKLPPDKLVYLLACNDPSWAFLRSCAQCVDRYDSLTPEEQASAGVNTIQALRRTIKNFTNPATQAVAAYLTDILDEVYPLGAPEQGGSGEA